MSRLGGKVALITGAATGIGRRAPVPFAEAGARVVVADIDREAGEEVARLVPEDGGECRFVVADVTERDSMRAAVELAVMRLGQLDVHYNNAGGQVTRDAAVTEIDLDAFWHAIKLNSTAPSSAAGYGIRPSSARAGGAWWTRRRWCAHRYGRAGRLHR